MDVNVPCPNCGTVFTIKSELLGKRTKCTNCGNAFVLTAPVAPPPPKPAAPEPFELPTSLFPDRHAAPPPPLVSAPPFRPEPQLGTEPPRAMAPAYTPQSPAGQQRFPALRIVARLYEVLAVIALASAALLLLLLLINSVSSERPAAPQIFWSAVEIGSMLGAALTCLFIAQAIRLGLQIEENTRATQTACRELADHLCAVEREP